jgi:hypothetical protein
MFLPGTTGQNRKGYSGRASFPNKENPNLLLENNQVRQQPCMLHMY